MILFSKTSIQVAGREQQWLCFHVGGGDTGHPQLPPKREHETDSLILLLFRIPARRPPSWCGFPCH